MSNGKLSNKDLEVLTGIVMFLNENGFPPTVRELCNILGYASTSTVHRYSPRKGENVRKGYLKGRFGAIPFIGGDGLWQK